MKRLAVLILVILFLSTNKINGAVQEKFFDFWPRMQKNVPPNQWVQLPSPGGGWINDIKIAPSDQNRMFVPTAFGSIFRSDDAGAHWVNTDRRFANFGCIPAQSVGMAIDPQNPDIAYANTNAYSPETDQFYLLKTQDAGQSWGLGDQPEDYFDFPHAPADIVSHPQDGRYLYSGSWNNYSPAHFARSNDYGKTWYEAGASKGLNLITIETILLDQDDPEHIMVGGAQAYPTEAGSNLSYPKDEIWRIDPKHGISQWIPSSDGLTYSKCESLINVIVRDPSNPKRLYAGGELHPSGIYLSEDDGQTWRPWGTGFYIYHHEECGDNPEYIFDLVVHPIEPNVLFASAYSGVYRSLDYGATWTLLKDRGLPIWEYPADIINGHLAIQPQPPYAIFAGFDAHTGIFVSYDKGDTWQPANEGLSSTIVHNLMQNPAKPYEFLANVRSLGLYRSDAQGHWTKILPKEPEAYFFNGTYFLARGLNFPNIVYLSASPEEGLPQILVTEDWGETWEDRSQGLESACISEFGFSSQNSDHVYAWDYCSYGVYRTTTGGREGWERAKNRGLIPLQLDKIESPLAQNNQIQPNESKLSVDRQELSRVIGVNSDNSGPHADGTENNGPSLDVDPLNDQRIIFGGSRPYGERTPPLYISNDAGDHWQWITPPIMEDIGLFAVRFDPLNQGVIFVGGCEDINYENGKLFRFNPNQSHPDWEEIILPIEMSCVQRIVFAPSDPASMYIASNTQFLHSQDSGKTWEVLSNKGYYFNTLGSLNVDMHSSDILYAGTYGSGILGYVHKPSLGQAGQVEEDNENSVQDMFKKLVHVIERRKGHKKINQIKGDVP